MRPRKSENPRSPLAEEIKCLREEGLGMTQQQFASRLAVSMNTVARWETGRVPDDDGLCRLMRLAKQCARYGTIAMLRRHVSESVRRLLKDPA